MPVLHLPFADIQSNANCMEDTIARRVYFDKIMSGVCACVFANLCASMWSNMHSSVHQQICLATGVKGENLPRLVIKCGL